MHARWRRLLASCAGAVLLGACTDAPDEDHPSLADRMSVSVERGLAADSRYDPVRAVLVTADGEPLVEQYVGASREQYHPVMSVTKSVLSTVVGVAVDEGLLSLDDTVEELLPDHAGLMGPRVASVTLADLLTMRGGFIREEEPGGLDFAMAPDATAAALATGQGTDGTFGYSSADVQLVTAALAEATGGSVLDYAREVLFDPLGVDTRPAAEPVFAPASVPEYLAADFAWPVDRQGMHLGWSGLKLRPRDLLSFGQLVLARGQWRGEQLVSEAWLDEATSAQVEDGGDLSYGYLWWRTTLAGRDAVFAWGYGGQSVVVVPDLDLVAVTVAELDQDLTSDVSMTNILNLVESAIAVGFGRR